MKVTKLLFNFRAILQNSWAEVMDLILKPRSGGENKIHVVKKIEYMARYSWHCCEWKYVKNKGVISEFLKTGFYW